MNEIGNLLKVAREKQGLSLEDVAKKTKIHIYKLESIEAGNLEALPAKVFTVGLIKSYARELKVDMDQINKLCSDTFDLQEDLIEVVSLPEKEEPQETQPVGRFQISKAVSIMLSLLVIVGLIGIIFLVVQKMNSYSLEEKIPQEEIKAQPIPEQNESENQEQPESQSITVSEKKEEKIPQEDISEPEASKPEEKKEVDSSAVKDQEPERVQVKEQTETTSQIVRSDSKLTITSLEPVRLEIVWSDGFVQVMLLKGQETKTLVFSTPIKLRINNGGVVKISHNGQDAKIPGELNQPVELNYP